MIITKKKDQNVRFIVGVLHIAIFTHNGITNLNTQIYEYLEFLRNNLPFLLENVRLEVDYGCRFLYRKKYGIFL